MDAIISEAGVSVPNETGGVLLGWALNENENYVSHMVGPGPESRHEPTSFEPDYEWQDGQIASLYEASGRRLFYLGDWHTHPGGSARPSHTDTSTLRKIAEHHEARCPDPVMLICGGPTGGMWSVQGFRLTNARTPRRWAVQVPIIRR